MISVKELRQKREQDSWARSVYTTQNSAQRESGETGKEIPFRAAEDACHVTSVHSSTVKGGNKESLASATPVSNYRYC